MKKKNPRLSLANAQLQARTIRANNVHRHNAYAEASAMNDGIRKAQHINNLKLEHDRLLGSIMHGTLGTFAHGRLGHLKNQLNNNDI